MSWKSDFMYPEKIPKIVEKYNIICYHHDKIECDFLYILIIYIYIYNI